MPMSNADNPAADQPVAEPAAAKKGKASRAEEPAPELAKASTSGSADVQHLLAEREIALSNQDDEHVATVDAKLAALGFKA